MQIVFLSLVALSFLFTGLAFLNLRGLDALWKVFVRGPLAGREYYSTAGWRYRNLALLCLASAAVVLFFT